MREIDERNGKMLGSVICRTNVKRHYGSYEYLIERAGLRNFNGYEGIRMRRYVLRYALRWVDVRMGNELLDVRLPLARKREYSGIYSRNRLAERRHTRDFPMSGVHLRQVRHFGEMLVTKRHREAVRRNDR